MAGDPEALLRKADKTLSGAGSGWSMFGGRGQKFEEAAELYTQAANAFRMARNNEAAGKAYEKAAMIQSQQLNEWMDASNNLQEASKAYRKTSPSDAARCLEQATNTYASQGNFRRAAGHMQTLGEIYEEIGDQSKAIECYEKAAGWFEDDNAEALANRLLLKCADLVALSTPPDYYKAIGIFEKVSKRSIDNNLMRYSVKDYLFKAGICHLATGDLVGTRRALEQYNEMDNSFAAARESQVLHDLTDAVEEGNQELFSEKLFQFDQVNKLDRWKTALLLRVKENIEGQEDDFS